MKVYHSTVGFFMWLCLMCALCGLLFQYALWSIFGKDIPWYGDVVAGTFGSAVVVPVAIGCWVARMCGVEVPFVHP